MAKFLQFIAQIKSKTRRAIMSALIYMFLSLIVVELGLIYVRLGNNN